MVTHDPTAESGTARSRLFPTFRALSHRNYRLFFFGQMVSLVGTWMQTIAQQWLIYQLTGSATMLGVVNLVTMLPAAPLSLWGGSLADRFSKRLILLVTQSTMMVLAFILATLTWTSVVQVWHVMVLAAAVGAAGAIDMPARQAFVVEMIEGKADLTSAIGLNSTIFNAARAIGPAIAGVAVATIGESGAFFVNGVTFIAVIASLLMMRLPAGQRPLHLPKLGAHLWEAVRYVRSRQVLMVPISLVAVSAFLSLPYSVLLPVFAQDVLRESARPLLKFVCAEAQAWFTCQSPEAVVYGLLMAASGLGAVLGALFVALLPQGVSRGWWLTLNNLSFPTLLIGMALSDSFTVTLVLLMGIGFSFVMQNALTNTLIQVSVPDELRGRILSFYVLAFQGMAYLGGVQAGVMGDYLGAPMAVGVAALACLAYGAFVAWRYPFVRNMA
jgi:MFS family permease